MSKRNYYIVRYSDLRSWISLHLVTKPLLLHSKCKSPTLRTCLDIPSCELEDVCLCDSNQGPLSLELLTACGARLMTEAAEYPATPSAPLLSGLQLCLQAVWRVLMYSVAQLCSPAPNMVHRSLIHAL